MLKLARVGGSFESITYLDGSRHGEWTACCDTNQNVLNETKKRFPSITTCNDYMELVRNPDIDVVWIRTPNVCHAEQANAFLEAGKHVFVEKPMALNREDITRMVKAARKADRYLGVDMELRYSMLSGQRPRDILASGEIGELKGLQVVHYRGGWKLHDKGIWRVQRAKSGGMHMMEACHPIDLMRSYAGDVLQTQSFTLPNVLNQYDFPDNIMTHLWFESGVKGFVLESHQRSSNHWIYRDSEDIDLRNEGHTHELTLIGDQGALKVDFWNKRLTVLKYETFPANTEGRVVRFERNEDYTGITPTGLHHDVSGYFFDFVRRIAEGKAPLQTGLDAAKTHLVCLAAEESASDETSPRLDIDYSSLV